MATPFSDIIDAPANPLDLIEEIVGANDWPFDRCGRNELVAEIAGRWSEYRMFFMWDGDMSAMHFSCAINCKVPSERRRSVYELLALVNEQLWLGHFDICPDGASPMFRHTLPLRGAQRASVEQLEDLVDIALTEIDRFFPAFQFTLWGGRSASDALASSLIETEGTA